MRDKFEAWATKNGLSITRTNQALMFANGSRRAVGDYIAVESLCAWAAWQASNEDAFSTPAAYADPQAFINFEAKVCTHEWMWTAPDTGLEPLYRRGELKC
jgi:hypothetical protein